MTKHFKFYQISDLEAECLDAAIEVFKEYHQAGLLDPRLRIALQQLVTIIPMPIIGHKANGTEPTPPEAA